MGIPARAVSVAVEVGPKRQVFAWATEWPGWCRAGRDEGRRARGTRRLRAAISSGRGPSRIRRRSPEANAFRVVERLQGSATTDFGAAARLASTDTLPLTTPEIDRLASLLSACWSAFDEVFADVPARTRSIKPRSGDQRPRCASPCWRPTSCTCPRSAPHTTNRLPTQSTGSSHKPAQPSCMRWPRCSQGRPSSRESATASIGSRLSRCGALPGTRWITPGSSRTTRDRARRPGSTPSGSLPRARRAIRLRASTRHSPGPARRASAEHWHPHPRRCSRQ